MSIVDAFQLVNDNTFEI